MLQCGFAHSAIDAATSISFFDVFSMKKVFCGALVFVDVHAEYHIGGGVNIVGGGTNIKAIGHAARNVPSLGGSCRFFDPFGCRRTCTLTPQRLPPQCNLFWVLIHQFFSVLRCEPCGPRRVRYGQLPRYQNRPCPTRKTRLSAPPLPSKLSGARPSPPAARTSHCRRNLLGKDDPRIRRLASLVRRQYRSVWPGGSQSSRMAFDHPP